MDRRGSANRGRACAGALAAVLWGGAAGGCSDEAEAINPEGPIDPDGETDTDGAAPDVSGDLCEDPTQMAAGRVEGTLRSRSSAGGGACGIGGPDVFYALDVPQRADVRVSAVGRSFEPVVGVLPSSCLLDWENRGLACSRGVPAWVEDVAAGTRLLVAVGIDPADPALQTSVAPDQPDALDFALEVRLRDVLKAFEVCEGGSGRCEVGTACIAIEDEASAEGEVPGLLRCQPLEADTCASAEVVLLAASETRIEVPTGAVHTDAHRHGCAGARTPDRVYRLDIDPGTRAPAQLRIAAQGAAAVAVRAGGCETANEVACTELAAGAGTVTVELDATAIRDGLYLFVELSAEYGPLDPAEGPAAAGTGEEPPDEIVLEVFID